MAALVHLAAILNRSRSYAAVSPDLCARATRPCRRVRASAFMLDLLSISLYTADVDRGQLIADLEGAIAEQRRCMGGVDPAACVTAARRVTELRAMLRNDPAFLSHLMSVMATPLRVPRRHR